MSTTSSVDCDRFEMTRHEYEEKLSSEFQTRQTFLVVIETLICLVITGVSILGNGLVFVAVYRNPRLRKPFNLYIISLAVSDLVLSAVAMPFTCVSAMVGNWMFGATLCWFQASLATMLGTTSLMNMALIAANRFLKVVYPNMHRKLVSVKTILISIAFAWCFTGAIPVSFYITNVHNVFHPGHIVCLFDFSSASYTLIALIGVFEAFIPYQVIFICYFKVWRFVKRHTSHMSSSNVNAEDVHLNRLLSCIVVSFTICYTPFLVIILIESFHEHFPIPRQVYFFGTVMVGLGSCVNPVIYGILNKDFREEFNSICRIRRRVEPQE